MALVNVDATRALANQASDMRLIASPTAQFHPTYCSLSAMNERFATVEWEVNKHHPRDAAVAAAIRVFIPMLAARNVFPAQVASLEEHTELKWANWRVAFAGLGHSHHRDIVEALAAVGAGCPWSENETQRQWSDAVIEARVVSPWPTTLLLLPWYDMMWCSNVRATDEEISNADGPSFRPIWREIAIAWHLSRTLRYDVDGTIYLYRGTYGKLAKNEASTALVSHAGYAALAAAINLPTGTHELADTAKAMCTQLNRSLLGNRQPLGELPCTLLASPFASLRTDLSRTDYYFDHKIGLENVWKAENGMVIKAVDYPFDSNTILNYEWPPESRKPTPNDLAMWTTQLVPSYDASVWPSELFAEHFPNARWRTDGHRAMFDAIFCIHAMRDAHPALRTEYPFVLFLAANPSGEEHIRNGKTGATVALISAFAPAAPLAAPGAATTDKQTRALLHNIHQHGTASLDEWRPARNPDHPLCRENLASMCVGGSVALPLMYTNSSVAVKLRAPLVANAKTVSLTPDIKSRLFVICLDQLTSAQMINSKPYDDAISGRLGLRLRLAGLGQVEAHDLAHFIQQECTGNADGWRFLRHRLTATGIYAHRHGVTWDEAEAAIDDAYRDMIQAYDAHTDAAENSGLLAQQEERTTLRVALGQLLDGLTPVSFLPAAERLKMHARSKPFSPFMVFRAMVPRADEPGTPLGEAYAIYTGQMGYKNISNPVIKKLLADDMALKMPLPGSTWVLPGDLGLAGWYLTRHDAGHYLINNQNPHLDEKYKVI